jgi:hypothetical protein
MGLMRTLSQNAPLDLFCVSINHDGDRPHYGRFQINLPKGTSISEMADENKDTADKQGSDTQTDDKQDAEGKDKAGTQTDDKSEGGDKPKTFTQDDLNRLLAKEKRDWEKKVAAAEEKAKLSDDERTKAELAETKAQLAERDKRDAAADLAAKGGVKNTKLFYSAYGSDLEVDAKGNITNFDEILASAKAESPELFGTIAAGSADGGEGKGNSPALTKEMIDKMTPAEMEKNWDAVSKFLSSQK